MLHLRAAYMKSIVRHPSPLYGNKQPHTTDTNPSSHKFQLCPKPPTLLQDFRKHSSVNPPHLTFPLPSVLWFRKQTEIFWFPKCKLTLKAGYISKSAGPPAPINFPISHFVHTLTFPRTSSWYWQEYKLVRRQGPAPFEISLTLEDIWIAAQRQNDIIHIQERI